MKTTLKLTDGRVLTARPSGAVAIAKALTACPRCREAAPAGLCVRGDGRRVESRDTFVANASAVPCGCAVGVLRVRVSTIFGLEEDEVVLNGPWRVY